MLQYSRAIRTSSGALQKDNIFLMKKSFGTKVISAKRPQTNVRVAPVRPKIVKYCQCHCIISVNA
jgi:hypothetical protein